MTEGEAKEHRAQELRARLNLLSEEDFSIAIGVTIPTLATWRSNGLGPAFTKLGKTVFYRPDDVRAWADKNVSTFTD